MISHLSTLISVFPEQTGGSGLGWQRGQCIMGVEVFLPIWQNGRQQPFVFSSQSSDFIDLFLHRQTSFVERPFCQQ